MCHCMKSWIKQFFQNPNGPCKFQDEIKPFFFSISDVDIKEELEDATPHVKSENEMKPLLITEKGFNGANYSMDEIDIKEEPPLQDYLVSEFYYKIFSLFF